MAGLTRKDQAAIKQLWTKYAAAFNKKKARAIARLYAPDGDLIGAEGDLVTGPRAIEEYMVERFSKLPAAMRLSDAKIAPARTIAGRAALVNGTWRILGVGPKPINVVGTFVVRRDRGMWSYVAARVHGAIHSSVTALQTRPHDVVSLLPPVAADFQSVHSCDYRFAGCDATARFRSPDIPLRPSARAGSTFALAGSCRGNAKLAGMLVSP